MTSDHSPKKNYHTPVLLNRAIEGLEVQRNGIYIDATYGGGGHSKEILKHLGEKGKLIAFDRDAEAHQNKINDHRLLLIHKSFANLQEVLTTHNIKHINGLLADLGVSSHQFDMAERGFSFRYNAQLDMRMDNNQSLTAQQVLNTYSEKELQTVFSNYGEVRNARTLAIAIGAGRQKQNLKTIDDLKEVIKKCVDKKDEKGYYAKVFQALRIEVNGEMEELKQLLVQTASVITVGGKMVIISYHSLEDRLVKNFLNTGNIQGEIVTDIFGNNTSKKFNAVTRKPVEPDAEEIKNNPRSRSAKLRIAERI